MPKTSTTIIGPRDLELLIALDRTPLTPAQLLSLSKTFATPFHDLGNLRRRLRRLADSSLVQSWPFAMATDGRSPRYYKLTRDGFRYLHGEDAELPRRRHFEEISHGRHFHTFALGQLITRLIRVAAKEGMTVNHFARENSVKFEAGSFTVYPDCAFQLRTPDGRTFHFAVELDNGTERVRTVQDIESIERKLRAYDLFQAKYDARDPARPVVLFVTTRSTERVHSIMDSAADVLTNKQRTVALASTLEDVLERCPLTDAVFRDHRGLRRQLIPSMTTPPSNSKLTKPFPALRPLGVA